MPEALLTSMLSVALATSAPGLHFQTPLSLTWANGEGQRAAVLTRTLDHLPGVPQQRLRIGVVLLYGRGIQSGTLGTLYGILGTPLQDHSYHDVLVDICRRIASMHRCGQDLHRVPQYPGDAPQDVTQMEHGGGARLLTGEGFSMHLRTNRGEDSVLGLELTIDSRTPYESIHDIIRSYRPSVARDALRPPLPHSGSRMDQARG